MECHLKNSSLRVFSPFNVLFYKQIYFCPFSLYLSTPQSKEDRPTKKMGGKNLNRNLKKKHLRKNRIYPPKNNNKNQILPISFLLTVLTATISLKVLGTPSCRQEIYRHAAAIASLDLPFRFFPSCTILNRLLALSTIVLVRFILSAMLEIVLQNLNTLSVSYWQNKGTLESV